MKVEYLRHEYTWSSKCITGPKVGWGVTGSSTPLDKDKLIDLEKMAAGTVSDPADRVPIESLVYSPECGYIKMITLPYHDGEDGRKSKMVHIYQVSEQVNMIPEAYLLPVGDEQWNDKKIGEYFAPVVADTLDKNVDEILDETGCLDQLPEFLQVVFKALFGDSENVNFVANWSEHEFAEKSCELMYAIHRLIPDLLCKKASYQSFTRGDVGNATFYFSKEAVGTNCVRLDGSPILEAESKTELEDFFYHRLAASYVKKDSLYAQMADKMSAYYSEHSTQSNTLHKLQWILLSLCMKAGEETVSKSYIMNEIPQLFYWCEEDEELKEIVDLVLDDLHRQKFDPRDYAAYLTTLVEGYTKRAEKYIGEECIWCMKQLFHQRTDLFKKQIKMLQKKNTNLYTIVLSADIDQDDSFASQIFDGNTPDFLKFRTYLLSMNLEVATEDFKDRCLVRSIDLLNEDLFRLKSYQCFDEIVKKLERQKQAAVILKSFILQLQELRTDLDDERLETGSYVESLLNEYEGADKYTLLTSELTSRQIKPSTGINNIEVEHVSTNRDPDVTDEIFFSQEDIQAARKKKKKKKVEEPRAKEAKWNPVLEENDQEEASILEFLAYTFPMSFLSGCMFYILHFAMKIGHAKISIGMLGMWILAMINYMTYLQIKQKSIRTWQTVGLCVTQGLIITVLGIILTTYKVHFIFFILLGVLAFILLAKNFLKEREERLRNNS